MRVENAEKRARQDVDIQALPAKDRKLLERAARLLNKSLSQLVDAPNDEAGHQVNGANTTSAFHLSQPQVSVATPRSIQSNQPWLAANRDSSMRHSSSGSQVGHGMVSQLNTFDIDGWQNMNMTQGNNAQAMVQEHSSWDPRSFVTGTIAGSSLQPKGVNLGLIESGAYDSDKSSAASENETSMLDPQAWEAVQISSMDDLVPPQDQSGADYVWLYDDPEATQSASESGKLDESSKAIQAEYRSEPPKSLEPTQQKGRRAFQSQALRDETSNTRKLKACVRCRMQKIRVSRSILVWGARLTVQCTIDELDPSGQCKTCQAVSTQRLYTLPCVRYKITECTLYRIGKAPGLEFTYRWPVMKLKDITKWDSDEIREIRIQSDVCDVPFALTARKFVPLPQDSRKRGWMDGKVKKFKETTPYAIVNMQSALKDMKEYIDTNVFECMRYFLRASDPLVKETYSFIKEHAERHRVSQMG